MASGGGLGRFSRGKPSDDGSAPAAASTTTQAKFLATDKSNDASSGFEDDSSWMQYSSVDDDAAGMNHFDVSGVGVDYSDFTFPDVAPMEEEMQGVTKKQDNDSASAASTGLRIFKNSPSAKQGNNSGQEVRAEGRNPSGTEASESSVGMTRIIPAGNAAGKTNMTDSSQVGSKTSEGNETRPSTIQNQLVEGSASRASDEQARGPSRDAHGTTGIRSVNVPGADARSSQGVVLRQGGHSDDRNTSHLSLGTTNPSALMVRGSSTDQMNNASASIESRNEHAAFEFGLAANVSHWAPTFDPTQVFVTANESTRVIPVPPSARKQPPAQTSQSQHRGASPSFPTQSGNAENNMITRTPGSSSQRHGMRVLPSGQPARSTEQRDPYANPGVTTPGSSRGQSFASKLPAVTPGNEESFNQDHLEASPMTRKPTSVALGAIVTPAQDGAARDPKTASIDNRDESPSGGERANDHEALNFEDLHAKFLSDIRDLEDHQENNRERLLAMEDLFASAYAETLQDQAQLLDLLYSAEKTSEMAGGLIARFDLSF